MSSDDDVEVGVCYGRQFSGGRHKHYLKVQYSSLGLALLEFRELNKLSLSQLAERLGLSVDQFFILQGGGAFVGPALREQIKKGLNNKRYWYAAGLDEAILLHNFRFVMSQCFVGLNKRKRELSYGR